MIAPPMSEKYFTIFRVLFIGVVTILNGSYVLSYKGKRIKIDLITLKIPDEVTSSRDYKD
jgi:hypothetical protein